MEANAEANTGTTEGAVKVNGEVNGSYELMEVDGESDADIISVKKVASDINCVSEVNKNDLHEDLTENDKTPVPVAACEVPREDEVVSSNGLNTNGEEILAVDSKETLSLNNEEEKEKNDSCQLSACDSVVKADISLDHNDSNSQLDSVKNETESAMEVDETDTPHEDLQKKSNDLEKSDDQIKSENDSKNCEEKDISIMETDSSVIDKSDQSDNPVIVSEQVEDLTEEKSKVDEDPLDSTPDKGKKSKKVQQPINITPRRSSRNLNKQKSYIEKEDELEIVKTSKRNDDPDIEEITPVDPLADTMQDFRDKENNKFKSSNKKNTIVVNDTKRLVEIASGGKQSKMNKKEPTLVIIDTNSILSGRGPIPIGSSSSAQNVPGTSRSSGYSVLPVALPAQGMYPQMRSHSQMKTMSVQPTQQPVAPPPPQPKPPIILPSLTDDMYVVEAPSFIVPYVYEKPPIKPLKDYVDQIEQAIKEIKEQLEKNEKEEKKDAEVEKKKEETEKEESKADEEESGTKDEVKVDEKESEVPKESKSSEEESVSKDESSDDKQSPKTAEENKEDDKVKEDETSSEDVTKKTDDLSKTKGENKEEEEVVAEKEKEVESINILDSKSDEKSSAKSSVEEKDDSESVKVDDKSDVDKSKKSHSYFDNPLGKFFIQIGVNLVQEHVQTDLLRSQKRKKDRDGANCAPEVQMAITSLIRTLEFSKENNEPFRLEQKKCEFCSFKTESALVMAHHLETPHMRNYVYRCNFCPLEVRSPHDILFHMEAEHNVRGRLERAPAFHQCPSCPFEDNQKGKLTRHLLSCAKKYRPERNQEPPLDFEPPAKIPRMSRNRPSMSPGNAVYQAAMSGLKQGSATHPLLPKLVPANAPSMGQTLLSRGRGRPQMLNRYIGGDMRSSSPLVAQQKAMAAAAQMRPGMLYRPSGSNAQPQVLLPTSYQLTGNQMYQNSSGKSSSNSSAGGAGAAAKLLQQPSISITPLPRQQASPSPSPTPSHGKPGRPLGSGKATFVICEICDGYIKDLEQLRNHMQWIHKVKIHPKMIYNRPPLNCQKCQFRFFTDQGLERHLLGSHGLVTSSMQEAANKGKDGGRCPVCGRVYQWKLLNHVARDHNMSLKPAHLSYKCTVCTATFGMYKQFENHVYSAHSVVAKRVMDKKNTSASQPSTSTSSHQGDSLLKPLKINDEITIIPQPVRSTKPMSKPGPSSRNIPQAKGKV